MATTIVDFTNVNEASLTEDTLPSGIYEVRFYVKNPLTSDQLADLKNSLTNGQVDLKRIYQSSDNKGPYVGVVYQRMLYDQGISQLGIAIVGLISAALVPILVGIGIFKIGDISSSIVKVLLVGGGIAVVLAIILKKPLERVAEKKFL